MEHERKNDTHSCDPVGSRLFPAFDERTRHFPVVLKAMLNFHSPATVATSINRAAKRLPGPMVSNRAFAIFFVATILIAVAFLLAPKAHAANRTWSNTGTDFNTGANWGGTAPGSGDVAVFSNAKVTNPNLSASLTIQELNFSTTASSGYDLTSSSTSIKLTLTNTGTGATSAINAANTSGTNIIDAPLVLGASSGSTQTFTQASGGTLVVNGIISGTINTLALTGGGTGNFTFAGANTFTVASGITIDGGTLKLGNATALGVTANTITVANSTTATLDLNGQSIANAVTITGGGIGGNGALINSSGTAATLSGTLDGSSTPTFGGSGNITISGQIVASGSSALTKVGTGTVFFTNNTNNYTRPTNIVGGVINIQAANALGATGGSSATTVQSGAALQIQGGITTAAEGLTLNGTGISNDGALRNISGNNNYTGAIVLASASRINSDANTLTLSGGITGTGLGLTVGGTGNTTISTTGINTSTGGTLTKDGSGTLTISASGNYTGLTTVSAGILDVQNNTALGTTAGATTVTSGAAVQVDGSGLSIAEPINTLNGTGISNGGALRNLANNNTWSGAITLGSASRINSDAGTLTVSGGITGTGNALTVGGAGNTTISTTGINTSTGGTLTKDGNGTLTISAASNYTGTTTINAGTLSLDNAGSTTARLANTTSITVNSGGSLLLASSSGSSNDRINNAAKMFLNASGSSTVAFNTAGLSEHGASNNTAGIGALTLQSTSIIDMGSASSIIAFANSNNLLGNSAAWSGTLKIYDWSGTPLTGGGTDQLFFGNDATGLSAAELASIQFYSGAGTGAYGAGALILANGEVVPIPEPSTWVGAGLTLATLLYTQKRRVRALFARRVVGR